MGILTVLVLILGLASAFGSGCTDISGKWENELGSIMRLELKRNNRLTGEYWTAVESSSGAARVISNITGIFFQHKKGPLLAFSVLFNHGASLTSWVGQCTICDGKEILHTTYVLRKYITDPTKKWTSLIINQNTFWRTHKDIPTDPLIMGVSSSVPYPDVPDNSLEGMHISREWNSVNGEIIIIEIIEVVPGRGIHISGKWKRNNSEEIQVYGMIDKLRTEKPNLSDMQGRWHKNATFAVALVGKIDGKVRGWTGHIPVELSGVSATLETSWLEHEFSQSCLEPRANIYFGMGNYTEVTSNNGHIVHEPVTFMEKIRRFFTSMF